MLSCYIRVNLLHLSQGGSRAPTEVLCTVHKHNCRHLSESFTQQAVLIYGQCLLFAGGVICHKDVYVSD